VTWLQPADVATWLRTNTGGDPADDVELVRVCEATEAYVQRCRPEWMNDAEPPVYTPDRETYQGAVMYAARETRRRNSPAGIEQFADGGTTFVSKWDSDIERFLRTGTWTVPGVG
jgi:hypothetical protein